MKCISDLQVYAQRVTILQRYLHLFSENTSTCDTHVDRQVLDIKMNFIILYVWYCENSSVPILYFFLFENSMW